MIPDAYEEGETVVDTVEDQLVAIVRRELSITHAVTTESRLADLGDSLDQITLLSALEEAFAITITNEQAGALNTVGDVLRLLKEPVHG